MAKKGKAAEAAQTAAEAYVSAEVAKAEEPLTEAEKNNPVQTAVAKRLRAARKRLTKIANIETAENEGKELNSDQVQPSRLFACPPRVMQAGAA